MHRKQLNTVRLPIAIRPNGPILIKSGHQTPDPVRPQMEFVRTRHAQLGETVYLPGSGLKGAIRAHAERILRGLGLEPEVCNPLANGCRHGNLPPAQRFKKHCAVCRTFGSLGLRGRFHLGDALPQQPAPASTLATETRWQVAIDRLTQQAHPGALFDLEVVVGGRFHTEVVLNNVQLWQVGLVLAVLREMDAGQVAIGFGKTRGLGRVAVDVLGLEIDTVRNRKGRLLGTGALVSRHECDAYGLVVPDELVIPAAVLDAASSSATWRGTRCTVPASAVEPLAQALIDGPLTRFLASSTNSRAAGGGK